MERNLNIDLASRLKCTYIHSMKTLQALAEGDTIGIAASASPFDRKNFMKGIHVLERMGFKTLYGHDIFDQNRYLAGTDKRRAEEFTKLFLDRNVAAIMFARGGYGSQRIIPLLDRSILEKHSKPVIGFSDITALLTFLRQDAGVPTFYGPVMTGLGKAKTNVTGSALLKALTTSGALGSVPMGKACTIRAGRTTGRIVGGCLSLINSSMGTSYELETSGCILFIEEIGEKVYVLDRMLTQLKNSGKLSDISGIIFGSIIPPKEEPHDVKAMILDVLDNFNGPIICDYPAGHVDDFITLPLGVDVELAADDTGECSITYSSGLLT